MCKWVVRVVEYYGSYYFLNELVSAKRSLLASSKILV